MNGVSKRQKVAHEYGPISEESSTSLLDESESADSMVAVKSSISNKEEIKKDHESLNKKMKAGENPARPGVVSITNIFTKFCILARRHRSK
jgi:hypothetical protein